MARNPGTDAARARFVALLAGHLARGTRPNTDNGEPWTDAALAREVQSSRDDSDFASPRSVSNWRKGTSLPLEIGPILRALFGPDTSTRHAAARDELRAAYIDCRRAQLEQEPLDQAGPTWVVRDSQFTIDRAASPSDAAAAADPQLRQLQTAIRDLAEELIEPARRLSNTRAWAKLSATAAQFHAIVACDPAEIPGRLGELYPRLLRLGRYLETDVRLRADPNASDNPLDADLYGGLTDVVRTAAPWLRGYPTVAKWDDEAGKALVRPDLFTAAQVFIGNARTAQAIPARDAEDIEMLAEIAGDGGFLADKAGNRAAGGVGNLIRAAALAFATFLSGAVSSDFATRSVLVQRAGRLLATGEAEILQFAATWPDDMRHALLALVQEGKRLDLADTSALRPPPPVLPLPAVIRDGPDYPELVLIPKGNFEMGVPEAESAREETDDSRARPVHPVQIAPFYLGKYHVTRGQYAVFAKATKREIEAPSFEQTDEHPVVNVSWNDAQDYVAWLSERTGKPYRLPTEAEWEYAARAGKQTARYWGDSADLQHLYANGADQTLKAAKLSWSKPEWPVANGSDGYVYTSPVGSFEPNAFGLYDILGNAWQWVQDRYTKNYNSAPSDGSVDETGDNSFRVLRGGSWNYGPGYLRAGYRLGVEPANRLGIVGLRVARTLTS